MKIPDNLLDSEGSFGRPFECPICGSEDTVYGSGPQFAPAVIVGEFPGTEEVMKSVPMVGRMGTVLNMELHRIGHDINNFRLCNLWHHPPNDNPACLQYGAEQMMREIHGRRAVLLLGSDVCKYFGMSVMDVTGMQVHPTLLGDKIVVASVNPAYVFSGGVGELRLAITRFGKLIEKIM